jgi:hypothetical protein
VIFELGRRGDRQHIVIFCVWDNRHVYLLQATATPEVESIYAGTQMSTIGLHTSEGEHTHPCLSSSSTNTGKLPDIAARPCNIKTDVI